MKKIIIFDIILLIIYFLTSNVKMVTVNLSEEIININEKITEENTEENIEENIEDESDLTDILISSRSAKPRTAENNTVENKLEGYRITSYYPGDNCATGMKTGSGKSTNDFTLINIDGKNVYAYENKIVVAGATNELLKSGYNAKGSQKKQDKHYFSYYDTGRIKINDNWYSFIVLDSCGASMWEGYYRLDIFVPSSKDVIDIKNAEIIYN